LAGIAKDGTNEGARVSAAQALLDRGWGKAPQAHTGEDGEGEIKIVIRRLVDEDNAKLIEGRVLETIDQDVKNLLEASEDPAADD
jgi:hypothetical protein